MRGHADRSLNNPKIAKATADGSKGLTLRVAVATREGQRVDLHFGHAEKILAVYDPRRPVRNSSKPGWSPITPSMKRKTRATRFIA